VLRRGWSKAHAPFTPNLAHPGPGLKGRAAPGVNFKPRRTAPARGNIIICQIWTIVPAELYFSGEVKRFLLARGRLKRPVDG